MRSLSDEFVNAKTRYYARIVTVDGVTELDSDDIQEFSINSVGVGSSSGITLGGTPSAKLTATIVAGYNLQNRKVKVYIGRMIDGQLEEISLGVFIISDCTEDDDFTVLTGYDCMYTDLEGAYYPEVEGSTTAKTVLSEIGTQAGIDVVYTSDVPDVSISGMELGYTMRETIGFMSALLGCNARINDDGNLAIGWFKDCELTKTADDVYSGEPQMNTEGWELGKLTCSVTTTKTTTETDGEGNTYTSTTTDSENLTSGDGNTGISFSNNFMTQSTLDSIYSRIGGLTYKGGSASMLGDLRIEPWDVITLEDYKGNTYTFPVMSATFTYDGGLITDISTYATAESVQGSTTGPITAAMERMTAQMGIFENLQAENLNAINASITNLQANYAIIAILEADIAYIEEAYIDRLEAEELIADLVQATIGEFDFLTVDEADIRYASITDLDAALANITILNADLAAINYLLTGHESTETADIIHLTTDTAIIDEAVIANALVGTLLAQLIDAEYINTNQITIASEDGGITIVGNQMQIVDGQLIFYDENGTVRMQIGQDASGAFSFVLYDETGTGIMIDSEGIHESAVPDGLIVDSMVAEDAAIQGSKLDIASVAECLTEDGSLQIDYANVVIGDTNLSAWYTTINEAVDGLWTETSVLQTSLDVVQGQIEAKVWQSDIDDAVLIINDQMETLNDKIEGLSTEGLISVTPYFCLWTSDTEAPPDDESLYSAICGTAVCGLTICGLSEGDTLWKDYDMPVTEGLYKWVKWLGTYLDGHTEWSVPYCVSDGWTVAEVTTLTEQYADLSVNVDSITAGVSDLYYVVYGSDEDNYAGLMAQAAELQIQSDSISSSVETVEALLYGDGEEDLGLESRITSLIEQTSSDLSIVFSNAISETVDTIEGVQEQVNTINTYFDFSTDGLRISSSDSDFYLLIANNRIGFWQSEDEVAYISNSMLNIYDAYVSDSLQIGTFRWLPRESGNLSFIKATESKSGVDTPDEGGDDN